MLRTVLRASIGAACRGCGLLTFEEQRARGQLTIVCYHRVLPARRPTLLPDLAVSPEAFRRHCEFLRRTYRILPLSQAVHLLRSGDAGRQRLAAITFDDGYQDSFLYAAPILAEIGLQATFFVIAGLVGRTELPWYDRLARCLASRQDGLKACELLWEHGIASMPRARDQLGSEEIRRLIGRVKELPAFARSGLISSLPADGVVPAAEDRIMSWPQLQQLGDAGHEIGSHSMTHEILTQLSPERLNEEVQESRRLLQDRSAQPVESFCYPNGNVNAAVAAAVRAAGYDCAVGVEQGTNTPDAEVFHLKRWFIHERRLAGLSSIASPTLFRMELCGLSARLRAMAPARRYETGVPG